MEGIFQATPEEQFITANKALSHMLGYESPDELMAAIMHIPTQLYAREEDHAALLKILNESGSVNRYEAQFRRKDGRHIWISTNMMSVRNNDGQL
ncbi:MAG: PAS domain-containing protein, partial [Syntrophales bacterium]|nr:PAS domain-containing protein [Syntrophales bacterium]